MNKSKKYSLTLRIILSIITYVMKIIINYVGYRGIHNMRKKELKKIFAGFLMTSVILAGCNNTNEAEKKEEPAQESTQKAEEKKEETPAFDINQTATAKEVSAYLSIKQELEKMKENQQVNWDQVISTYTSDLQNSINEINSEYQQATQVALESGKSGDVDQNIARQLFDKTTQSYFYQKQKRLQQEISELLASGKTEEAKNAFEEVKLLANEVFIPTATKRDELYSLSGEASIVENIHSGITTQEEALNSGNADDFKVFSQITDKSIYKSYYLAANSYAEKIEAAVKEGKEDLELKNMQAEAWGFYQAIKESLSGGDEAAATKLNDIFSLDKTNAKDIKAEEVNTLFVSAIKGKIKGYHEKAPAELKAGNTTEARVKALEGNMFMKMLEIKLNEKLGAEQAKTAFETAQKWYDAIAAGNAEEAKTHSEAVLAVLEQL